MYILGISGYYHDSAAVLLKDGIIVSALQEERFTRKKHDARFPKNAIEKCLAQQKISLTEVNYICFYDKPLVKFERLLETYVAFSPKGFRSFVESIPIWLKEKLYLKTTLKKELSQLAGVDVKHLPTLLFNDHHHSHAASAFFPSPYNEAAVLCMDGVGEWATTSVWFGKNNSLKPLWEIHFPHSLGMLYSAFTYYAGFKVNSGEYKLMGLAPYGRPCYVDLILNNLIDVKDDGTFRLDMSYFNYATGLTMTSKKFHKLFGSNPRQPETEISQKEMDIASSIQEVIERIILKLALTIKKETDADFLCLAGGVALNCVANGKLLREGIFKDIWIQPAAGDAGGALGAAFSVWYEYLENNRISNQKTDHMRGSFLGTSYDNNEICEYLNSIGAIYSEYDDDDEMMIELSEIINDENVVGWFSGPMEFGPRALGGRSIIGNPQSTKMQSIINRKIKYRESFRPFAPAVKAENVSEWFQIDRKSPYMLLVASIEKSKCLPLKAEHDNLFGIENLKVKRSCIPAVTHVDYSARIQTVHKETNPRFYKLIGACEEKMKCPILINTSFNIRSEPIVENPEDAYRCFMRTEMDYLVLENILLHKKMQPAWNETSDWENEFELD
jgi:carbamoyltransferase